MIPPVVSNDRTAGIGLFGTFIQGLIQSCLGYHLPLCYEGVKGYSPVIAGVALLPQVLGSGPATIATGLPNAKTHSTRAFSLLAWLLFVYGIVEWTLLRKDTPVYEWIVLNTPLGIGIGILFLSLTMSTQASAESRSGCTTEEPQHVKAIAASIRPFFRVLGQACGIVVGQPIFTNQITSKLGSVAAEDAVTTVKQLEGWSTDSVERIVVTHAFMSV